MQTLDSKKSGLFKVLMSIVFFFMFLEFRGWLKSLGIDYTTLKGSTLILLSAIVIAISCFFITLTTKVYDKKIMLTTKTKIFLGIFLVVVSLYLYLIKYEDISKVFGTDKMVVLIALLGALQPGILEEFLVRGLMFQGIIPIFKHSKHQLVLVSVVSSIMFGVMHLSNLNVQPLQSTIQQIICATILGLMFCVIRIKFNGLTLCILIHTLIDFSPKIKDRGNETSSWVGILIIFIPILLISLKCLFQLNSDYQKSIIELEQNQKNQTIEY